VIEAGLRAIGHLRRRLGRPHWVLLAKALDVYLLSRVTTPRLPRGRFVAVQPTTSGVPITLTFVAAARETMHVRHVKKYADSQVPPERRFFFRDHQERVVAEAESLHGFRHAAIAVPDDALGYHAARGDLSRWVRDVFADRELARELEKSAVRWRRGEIADLGRAIDRLILNRYGPES
jgi:hypothetical protein